MRLAAAHDVDHETSKKPVIATEIKIANKPSRIVNTSDSALTNETFERICKERGFPTANVLAGQAWRFHKHRQFSIAYFMQTQRE